MVERHSSAQQFAPVLFREPDPENHHREFRCPQPVGFRNRAASFQNRRALVNAGGLDPRTSEQRDWDWSEKDGSHPPANHGWARSAVTVDHSRESDLTGAPAYRAAVWGRPRAPNSPGTAILESRNCRWRTHRWHIRQSRILPWHNSRLDNRPSCRPTSRLWMPRTHRIRSSRGRTPRCSRRVRYTGCRRTTHCRSHRRTLPRIHPRGCGTNRLPPMIRSPRRTQPSQSTQMPDFVDSLDYLR